MTRRHIAQAGIARLSAATSAASLAALLVAMPVRAQSGTCAASSSIGNGADICQKARDLFAFVVPQIGVAVSAGNPLPGDAGTLGGLSGKRALSLRIVGVDGRLPRNAVPLATLGGTTASEFGAARTLIPLPVLDVGIGVFPGIPVGVTNVAGVDVLLGTTYMPTVSENEFEVRPQDGGFGFSYGVRVGALQESSFVPGLSVSLQRRQLPRADFRYTPSNDSLNVTGTSVRSDALRIVLSKRIALFGLAAGVGQDRIQGESDMRAVVREGSGIGEVRQTVALTGLRESTRRRTAFVNAAVSLFVMRVVGEFGWSSAGSNRETVNTFGGRSANEGYRYASIGLTARF